MSRTTFAGRTVVSLGSLALLAGLVGCQEPIEIRRPAHKGTHYLRHNLLCEGGETQVCYRSNLLSHRNVIPYGSEVMLRFYSTERIDMQVAGKFVKMYYKHEPFPREDAGIVEFMDKHFTTDPEAAANPDPPPDPDMLSRIQAGRPVISMTKEEVLLAIGYPAYIDHDVPASSLDRQTIITSDRWTYSHGLIMWVWPTSWVLEFADGKLANIQQ